MKIHRKHVDNTLFLIQTIWDKYPEIRFNQLIHNLQLDYIHQTGEKCWEKQENVVRIYGAHEYIEQISFIDMFNLEDDKFIKFLEQKVSELNV